MVNSAKQQSNKFNIEAIKSACASFGAQARDRDNQVAAELRELAIAHLRSSNQPVAEGFRLTSAEGLDESALSFLNRQARDGTWGTYIELMALAEEFGFSVVVYTSTGSFPLYNAGENAPVMEVENWNNTHWQLKGHQTPGDGNCLYHAVRQFLDKVTGFSAEKDQIVEAKTSCDFSSNPHITFPPEDTIRHQQELYEKLSQLPNPEEMVRAQERETARFNSLPEAEKKQIHSDYQLALRLASEEMQQDSDPSFRKHPISSLCFPQEKFETGTGLMSPFLL